MTRAVPQSDPGRGLSAALLALCGLLGLLSALLVLSPRLAWGVERTTVFAPAAGAVLDRTFTVIVEVDSEPGEVIDAVEVQLNGPSNLMLSATRGGPADVDGVQRWSAEIDPLHGEKILSNGRHRLTARAVPSVGDPPPFSGHEVRLAVPIATDMDARPDPEDGTSVIVTWFEVNVPDLVGYRVERRPHDDGGRWTMVGEVTTAESAQEAQLIDTPAEPGAYRYRVVVIRDDGDGGEVLGASETRGVLTDPDEPQTFDPPQDAEPEPQPTPAPGASSDPTSGPTDPATPGTSPSPGAGAPGPVGRPGQVVPTPTTQPNTGTGQVSGPAPQPLPVDAAPPSTERPPRPAAPVVPFNDGIFDPELPVARGEASRTITETETAFVPGSRTPGGARHRLTEQVNRDGWSSIALSLLLLVSAGHVRRFMGDASRG